MDEKVHVTTGDTLQKRMHVSMGHGARSMEESLKELAGRLEHLAGQVGTRFIASEIQMMDKT